MDDKVNHPEHYTFGSVECIDAIHSALGDRGFIEYCQGNAMKYLWRHRRKGGVEDLEKAKWYIDRMIETEATPDCATFAAACVAEAFRNVESG